MDQTTKNSYSNIMTLKHSKICFIGMSGVGKSTFGKLIAKQHQYPFMDTDKLIQKNLNLSLHEFITKEGETAFMDLEEKTILSLTLPKSCIVATGGSVIYSELSMTFLQKHTHIVYLKDSLTNIKSRITDFNSRAIIFNDHDSINSLFEARDQRYQQYAHQTIEYPNNFSIKGVLSLITKELS